MKVKLLFLISAMMLFSLAIAGQQTAKNKDAELQENLEELNKATKDLTKFYYELSKTPVRKLSKTQDVQEEAEKYFQAWINGDAETVMSYLPSFKLEEMAEANKVVNELFKGSIDDKSQNAKSGKEGSILDELKTALKEMNQDTFKYNSVKIGEIVETGILDYEGAPKERMFAVLKYTADVYLNGEKDVINGRIIGYTDGKKWYFVDRTGLSENTLKYFGMDSLPENQ